MLRLLWEVTGGATTGRTTVREMWPHLPDAHRWDVSAAAQDLVDRGFAQWTAFGGEIGITPAGIAAYGDPTLIAEL